MTTSRRAGTNPLAYAGISDPPGERDAPTDERKLREDRILDSAAALLIRYGYRKTTIDDVAREAGVGKGTIYLHWKDKNELFRAALFHAQQQAMDVMMRRIAADPEGGLFHRMWAHGMLAAFDNPLTSAVFTGKTDLFQGLHDAYDLATLQQLSSDYGEYIVQLQEAGLMRTDLPVSIITFLTSALKIGIAASPEILGTETPPKEQLVDAISDLIRRWLEPAQPPSDTTTGKQLAAQFVEKIKDVEEHLE